MSTQQQPSPVDVVESTSNVNTSTDHVLPATSKKTSHQNRAKGARVSRGGHAASEEPMQASAPPRKKTPANHKDKEPRSRPPNQRSHKEASKTGGGGGGGASQKGKGGDHHSSRHRNGGGSSDGASGGRSAWGPNRWDKLEVDQEREISSSSLGSFSGDSWAKSSLSMSSASLSTSSSSMGSAHKGSEERRAKRRGRDPPRGRGGAKSQQEPASGGGGGKSVGHSAEDRSGGKEDRSGGKETKSGGKDDWAQKKPKQIKFDLPSEAAEQLEAEHSSVSVLEGASSSSTSTSSVEPAVSSPAPVQTEPATEPKKPARLIYDRETLLKLRELCYVQPAPAELKQMADLFPQPYVPSALSESPFPKDSTESHDENSRPKHPTALNLIKEHDKHFVSKVSLSPQRRSFQRGCSWKDSATSHPSEGRAKEEQDVLSTAAAFFGSKTHGNNSSHVPRVIHHVPLHEQGQASARQGKKGNWRDGGWKGRENEHHQYSEPEPEWMEFGPTDRFDVIELKGFEEHEVEKEGSDKELPADHKSTPEDKGEEPQQPQQPELEASPAPKPPPEEDNEFILDGFDFSTGVSICQELDLDDDEPGSSQEGVVVPPPPAPAPAVSKPIKDPSELGNALLKALGVGKKEEAEQQGEEEEEEEGVKVSKPPPPSNSGGHGSNVSQPPPANALTLDEVHARENIHPASSEPPTSTASTGEGMAAFNKLLAVLESKRSKPPKEEPAPYPNSVQPTASPPVAQKMRVPRAERPASSTYSSFPVEKELLDLEDDLPPIAVPYAETNLRRLEHLERMLDHMDRMDPNSPQLQGYRAGPSHVPHPPHHRMDQRVPPQLDREGRGWMQYQPQQNRARPHPSAQQQLVASRQQQQQQQQQLNSSRSSNNWAVEMEQRRIMELHQMQMAEKEMYTGGLPPQQYGKVSSSKPSISLLPTSVMRHIHTSKPPAQTATDLPKSSSISNRLDQDLTSKASQTHSVLNSLLNQTAGLTPPGPSHYPMHHHPVPHPVNMRMAPPPAGHALPKPGEIPPTGSVYPRYTVPMAHHSMHPYMY